MPIKLTEITKGDSINSVGNIHFSYDVTDKAGNVVSSATTTISVSYNNCNIITIAEDLIRDAEAKEYEAIQKGQFDKFDIIALKVEVEKQITAKAVGSG